jgi:hypothetical protein
MWHPYDEGRTIGGKGSEDGIIFLDEECDAIALITAERDTTWRVKRAFSSTGSSSFAITCIYGLMVHTRFFGTEDKTPQTHKAMKPELERIANLCLSTTLRTRTASFA